MSRQLSDVPDPRRDRAVRARAVASAHRARADRYRNRALACRGAAADGWQGGPADPTPFFRGWINFDAYLWGDADPASINPLFDFNTATELYRELAGALVRQLGGQPNVQIGRSRWEQGTNDRRYGRLLVVPIAFAADITDEPVLVLPIAQTLPAVPGSNFAVSTTTYVDWPDGQSTTIGTFTTP